MARTEKRKEFLHSIFTAAIEGGIDYWSEIEAYRWSQGGEDSFTGPKIPPADLDGFYAIITNNEGDWGVTEAYQPNMSGMQGDPHGNIFIPEEYKDMELRIDIDVVERGVNLLVDKVIAAAKSEDLSVDFGSLYLRQFVVQWLTDGEDGDSDACAADLAVQLGLFGEVVYA